MEHVLIVRLNPQTICMVGSVSGFCVSVKYSGGQGL